jgi:hypothetical protein
MGINSTRIGWAGHVACMGWLRNSCRVSVGKSEGKTPLRRSWHRWEDNTKMDLESVVMCARDYSG